MQGIFQKENTDKALKYGIYRHLPTYEKIIRNLVSFYNKKYIARNYEVIYTFGTAYLGLTEQETYKYLFGIIDNRTDSVSVSSYNDIY